MSTQYHAIAIDGPSGAGKSTLSQQLARALGYLHVDTGAIYRTVGLAACRRGISMEDRAGIEAILPQLDIRMSFGPEGGQQMLLNGEDVSGEIRRHEISAWASAVSAIPAVREFLLEMQRRMAREQNVIMDGRDIGTVVLPDADVKIFLTAQPEDRAHRRYLELLERGQQAQEAQVLRDVIARDEQDTHRATAPLRQAPDALVADTTGMSREESFQLLLKLIRDRLGEGGGAGDEK